MNIIHFHVLNSKKDIEKYLSVKFIIQIKAKKKKKNLK